MASNGDHFAVNTSVTKLLQSLKERRARGELDAPPEPRFDGPRLTAQLAYRLGPKYSPEATSLARYEVYHARQKAVFDRMELILEKLPEHVRAGRNIVWFGSVGTGKDHMLCALLYAAAQLGFDCDWRNVQRLNESSRDAMKRDVPERALVEDLVRPTVLGLSDPLPPAGQPSDWNKNLLYRILDERARARRCTWVTVNVSLDGGKAPEMERVHTELKESLSVPVWDRMREGAELLGCFWSSYRGRK